MQKGPVEETETNNGEQKMSRLNIKKFSFPSTAKICLVTKEKLQFWFDPIEVCPH